MTKLACRGQCFSWDALSPFICICGQGLASAYGTEAGEN